MKNNPWLWKMCTAIIIYLTLLDVVMPCSTSFNTGQCKPGWFGSYCKYKCRCESYQCRVDGTCQPGYKCQGGWFGPECQYVDMAYNRSRLYTDGNDRTCITNITSYITIPLNNKFSSHRITWLRLVLKKPWTENVSNSLNIEFQIKTNKSGCIHARNSTVDEHTLDFHCDLPTTVHAVTLQGPAVSYLCSVYVSGGRNVALGLKASYSSNLIDATNCAVDAEVLGKSLCPSCDWIPTDSESVTWTLIFQRPINVERVNIYKKRGYVFYRTVDYYTPENINTVSFKLSGNYSSYYAQTTGKSPFSSVVVKFQIKRVAWGDTLLCEFEVLGDSYCPKKSYGRECEHRCNCKNDSDCFVSTGGCPAGCAEGYKGESCNEFQRAMEGISPTKEETTSTISTIPLAVIGIMTVVIILMIIVLIYLWWRCTDKADNAAQKYTFKYGGPNQRTHKLKEPEASPSKQVSNQRQPENIEVKYDRDNVAYLNDSTNIYEMITGNTNIIDSNQ